MATTPQTEERLSAFRTNGFDLVRERREYEQGSDHERDELSRDEQRAQQILGGGTEDVSAGRRVAFAARAARERFEQGRAKRDKEDLEVFILTMILDGEIGAYVADQVVDGMSDAEISAFASRIEEVTGKPLEEYAAELLGEERAQRLPGESDADYKRRIVKAIHNEVMDVSVDPKGNPVPQIKPQYADDPYINDIFTEGVFQDYRDELNKIENDPDAARKIREFSERSYDAGDTVRSEIGVDELVGEARNSQSAQRDDGLAATERVDNNAAVIGDLLGDPGPREQASKALRSAFDVSSKKTSDELQVSDKHEEHHVKDVTMPRPA